MYEATDKRRLYQLIEMYLAKKITEETFCDDFVLSYDIELDHSDLAEEENAVFSELGTVASRFSPFEEDHISNPHFFYRKGQLKEKISETKEKLLHIFEKLIAEAEEVGEFVFWEMRAQ